MGLNVKQMICRLEKMTVIELKREYAEVFGEPTRSGNKQFLLRRIAWRRQALEHGDLSARARRLALEIANDAELRIQAPRDPAVRNIPFPGTKASALAVGRTTTLAAPPRHRSPSPGVVLTREYRGQQIAVQVLEKGFEYEGTEYRSLSAVAKAVTGSHWNGNLFFGLKPPKRATVGAHGKRGART